MIVATPRGAARPWRTKASLATIGDLLADGIPERDLLEHVAGAAELVARGLERLHWWTVGNVFGAKTLERWRNEIVAMRERDARKRIEDTAEELRAAEHARAVTERQPIANLQLHRMASAALASLQAQWSREAVAARGTTDVAAAGATEGDDGRRR